MKFARALVPGRLIQRYKRFLADVELEDGRTVTAHCANPGAMTGLADPGMRVWLEPNDDARRKLDWSWKLAELETGLACIDTSIANRVVEEALASGAVPGLAGYGALRREVKYGESSRIDFLLSGDGRADCHVEVKSVTLRRGACAAFPDTTTARGAKHMRELAAVARTGARAVALYLIQRTDCAAFRLAADIDPAYAEAARVATEAGVESLAFSAAITPAGVTFGPQRPIRAPDAG